MVKNRSVLTLLPTARGGDAMITPGSAAGKAGIASCQAARPNTPSLERKWRSLSAMKIRQSIVVFCLVACLHGLMASPAFGGDEQPLQSFPYTPALDVTAMDRSADPCEDFYQYSCGGWIASNPIPPDRASWNTYNKLTDNNLRYLWGILLQAADASTPRNADQRLIGDYFAACMDTAEIETRGLAPLQSAFEQIDGLRSRDKLAPLLARLHSEIGNGDLLFGYTSQQDFDNTEQFIGTFFSGGLGLPEREYYLAQDSKMQETRQRYLDHVTRMLELIGESHRRARSDARTILGIETELAEATLPVEKQYEPTLLNHPMPASQLQESAPGFDWLTYVRLRSPASIDRVNITEPEFAERVGRTVRTTRLRDLKTYLRWSYLRGHASLATKDLADESFAFNSGYIRGIKQQPPRWRSCVEDADQDIGEALGKVFVARTFNMETRAQAIRMIEIIQGVMRQRIESLDWMSEATKAKALAKLDAMRNKVGHPEKWRDYSALTVARDDYFGNRVRAAAFEDARLLAKIGKPVDRDEWSMTPQTVNAYYYPQMNEMVFSAGVLQPPLFDTSIDPAPSWGDTGGTVGHELIHGFDDSGRHFDAAGNLTDWWSAADAAEFEKRTQCLLDQYGAYTVVDDIKLNSKLTLGEDIADLAGIVLAYVGWKSVDTEDPASRRDGLSPEQRFFVGFAQWACGSQTDERTRLLARIDPHSPLKFRVNGVVLNLPEFAQAFHCKAGDALVKKPEEVCRIW